MIETSVVKQENIPSVDMTSKYGVDPSEDTLIALGDYLKTRFRKLKDFTERSKWEEDKANAFRAYNMEPKPRVLPYPGAANLACPLQKIGVDSFHANVMSSLFANNERIKLEPVIIQKDYVSTARKARDYMEYVMNDEAKFYMVMDDADKKAQMYGICYLEPVYVKEECWDTVDIRETKRQPQVDPMTGEVQMNEVTTVRREKKKRTTFDGVRINSLPVESVYSSPFLLTLEQAVRDDVVFKVFQMSWHTIKERSKKRKDGSPAIFKKSQVDKLEPFVVNKIYSTMSELEQEKMRQDGFYPDLLDRMEILEMAEAHLWWDIDGDDIKEEITVTFHRESGVVLKVSLAPCRIVEIVPRPVDDRFLGQGIPKICEKLAEEWEMFHNTRANAGQWENTPFGFYRAGGRFNPQAITIVPGRFYPVSDPREVNFAQSQRVGSSYFQEEQMILSYFERLFALDENMQGVGSSRRRTATESIRVSSKASIRFENPFNRIVSGVNRLLDHVWALNQECAPADKEYFVVGQDGAPLFDSMQKYDYGAKMKFSVSVSSVFDQQLIRDTMLLSYRLFMENPDVVNNPKTRWELGQKTLDSLGVQICLPKPEQANVLSPYEEHEMIKRGEKPEPIPGEDVEHHLKTHLSQINSEDFLNWDPDAQKELILHYDKTQILKQVLASANLNQSGIFPNSKPNQPSVTANPNPTQTFNTMRVGESSDSMKNNARGGNEEALSQALGPVY